MERRRIQESGEGAMKGLLKGALAVGGGLVGAEVARRTFFWGARPRYEPWERAPYQDFPNKVLILGGGFAGYTAAKTLCRKIRHRDDVGSWSSRGRTSLSSGRCWPAS